mmetsp:Transcript_24515/g.69901  ORF Transcript_24515/g.69901 Transcript_24515/m.69901 type:complete len:134 (-) Transcript_24515:324-725(-)
MAARPQRPSLTSLGSGASSIASQTAAQLQSGKTVCLGGKRRRWLVKVQAVTAMRSKKKQEMNLKSSEGGEDERRGEPRVGTELEATWNEQIRRIQQLTLEEEARDGEAAAGSKTGAGVTPSLVGKASGQRVEL